MCFKNIEKIVQEDKLVPISIITYNALFEFSMKLDVLTLSEINAL